MLDLPEFGRYYPTTLLDPGTQLSMLLHGAHACWPLFEVHSALHAGNKQFKPMWYPSDPANMLTSAFQDVCKLRALIQSQAIQHHTCIVCRPKAQCTTYFTSSQQFSSHVSLEPSVFCRHPSNFEVLALTLPSVLYS